MKVAVVGATGLVGQIMLEVLAERNFPVDQLIPVASARSVGKIIQFKNKDYSVVSMETAISLAPDIAILSAGGNTSKKVAPLFAEVGTFVIDNSSAWRMDETKKLIVPEINANELTADDKIIANPNCSTIQLVVALNDLHKTYEIDRLIVSTYQSVTGTGVKAVQQMEDERKFDYCESPVYPHPIDKNCLPHGGEFLDNGYTSEEMKLVHETRKIYGQPEMKITGTVVRVPVVGGHSESVNVSFKKPINIDQVREVIQNTSGVTIQDNVNQNEYPMPRYAEGKDDVFVGRIRLDESHPNALNMWVVSDNLRKGAATNAVQIAEYLLEKEFVQRN